MQQVHFNKKPSLKNINQQHRWKNIKLDPIKELIQNQHQHIEKNKMETYQALFGMALPMKLMFERECFGRSQRMIEEDSSYLLLKSSMNKFNELEFGDFQNYDNPNQDNKNMYKQAMGWE